MDTNVRLKLEQTLESFDRSVNMSLQNTRNNNEFLMTFKSLKREYVRYLEQVIEDAGFRSPTLLEYARSQFEVLISKYERNAQTHGSVVVEDMVRLNKAEFEQALEVLDTPDMLKEERKATLANNTKSKMNNLSYSQDEQRRADQTELRRLEDDLELMSQDIVSRINRVYEAALESRRLSSRAAEVEDSLYHLKSYINSRVNSTFLDRYGIAMEEHTKGIMVELEAKNEVWSHELDKIAEEAEKTKTTQEVSPKAPEQDEKDNPFDISGSVETVPPKEPEHEAEFNPFELSDDYKRKVEEVGKAPIKKKTAEEVYRELSELM